MSASAVSPSNLRTVFGQLWRFGLTGGFVTALGAAVYWIAATPVGINPLIANLLAYLLAMGIGYVMHSRFSFAGHGRRDNVLRITTRFFIVSLVSLALNSFWVWLLVQYLDGPTWWPIVPMLLVSPLVTFSLNRKWVFA